LKQKIQYDIKRLVRCALRYSRDIFAPKDGVPRYVVKWKTLNRFFCASAPVLESGTYLGESTAFFATIYPEVTSFEPYGPLAKYNTERFSKNQRIKIINKASQHALDGILKNYDGKLNFWLDGHFSGLGTFGKIENASPVIQELNTIFSWEGSSEQNKALIAIDDARLFKGQNGYPTVLEVANICNLFGYTLYVLNDIILISKQN
jgi:hypothetical protein